MRTNYNTENEAEVIKFEATELLKMIRSSILTSKSSIHK